MVYARSYHANRPIMFSGHALLGTTRNSDTNLSCCGLGPAGSVKLGSVKQLRRAKLESMRSYDLKRLHPEIYDPRAATLPSAPSG